MSRYLKLVLMGISCVLVLGIPRTPVRADSTATSATTSATGSITGTVTGVNGLTSGVTIKLFAYSGKHVKGSAKSTTGKHAKRATVVPDVTTDGNGAFTLTNVPEGDYMVIAILKGVGHGHAEAHLTGNTLSVSITLKSHQKKSK